MAYRHIRGGRGNRCQPTWDLGTHYDRRLFMRAMKERWPIPDDVKDMLIQQLPEVMRQAHEDAMRPEDTEGKAKTVWVRTAGLLKDLMKQNQDDEHLDRKLAAGQVDEGAGQSLTFNIQLAEKPKDDGE